MQLQISCILINKASSSKQRFRTGHHCSGPPLQLDGYDAGTGPLVLWLAVKGLSDAHQVERVDPLPRCQNRAVLGCAMCPSIDNCSIGEQPSCKLRMCQAAALAYGPTRHRLMVGFRR